MPSSAGVTGTPAVSSGSRFYRTVRGLFRLIARVMFRFELHGTERLPAGGPGIVLAAHQSWLDPACVGAACRRQVHFLMMSHIYHRRWTRWFYRGMDAIPLPMDGSSTLAPLREALRRLGAGELVGVFPEGRVVVGPRPGTVHPGAALLAVRSGAPFIPLGIRAATQAWPHGRRFPRPAPVSVMIGEPFFPPPGRDRRATDEMQHEIESLLVRLRAAGESGK